MNIIQPYNNGTTVFNASQSTGSTIPACKAVAFDTSNVVKLADSSVSNDDPVIGFTTSSIPTGGTGTIQVDGILAGFTGLTPGVLYFSDPATPGEITNILPVVTGQKIQSVGMAYSATQLLISIQEAEKAAATTAPLTVASGNTFPGSPNLYDRFYRTDRGIDYYYNGTVWLSMPLLDLDISPAGGGADGTGFSVNYPRYDYSIYIETIQLPFNVGGMGSPTTFDASNYWSVQFGYTDVVNTDHLAGPVTSLWKTGRVGAGAPYFDAIPVGQTVDSPSLSGANPKFLGYKYTKTGTPGIFGGSYAKMYYRLVG